jgi:hypothetical protein
MTRRAGPLRLGVEVRQQRWGDAGGTYRAESTSVTDAAAVAKTAEAAKGLGISQAKSYSKPPGRTASAASSSNTASVPSRRPTNLVPFQSRSSVSVWLCVGRELARYVSSLRNPGAPLSGFANGLPRLTGAVEVEDGVADVPVPDDGAKGL